MTISTWRAAMPPVYTESAWEIALLFPPQGAWTETDYLGLTTNHLVEFAHGRIEVLAAPNRIHQLIVGYFYMLLRTYAKQSNGIVVLAPLRLRLWEGKFREPDLLFLRDKHDPRNQEAFWTGADFVVEVVSPDDPKRDLVDKRREYAQAGIPEYWIVNPQDTTITVLHLIGERYVEHGIFRQGAVATTVTLPTLQTVVDDVFATD